MVTPANKETTQATLKQVCVTAQNIGISLTAITMPSVGGAPVNQYQQDLLDGLRRDADEIDTAIQAGIRHIDTLTAEVTRLKAAPSSALVGALFEAFCQESNPAYGAERWFAARDAVRAALASTGTGEIKEGANEKG